MPIEYAKIVQYCRNIKQKNNKMEEKAARKTGKIIVETAVGQWKFYEK
jgi:hypothetical protein